MVLASEEPMDRGMREALLAGLHVAAQGSERTLQAHALRLLGEWHEQEGAIQEAVDAYGKALSIDARIGVARKLEKLRKSLPYLESGAPDRIRTCDLRLPSQYHGVDRKSNSIDFRPQMPTRFPSSA